MSRLRVSPGEALEIVAGQAVGHGGLYRYYTDAPARRVNVPSLTCRKSLSPPNVSKW